MVLCFMIKKKYLEEKVREQEKEGTFIERRAYKPFWRSRIGSVHQWGPRLRHNHAEAVFLCGRDSWSAEIIEITLSRTPEELKDVVGREVCYEIKCKFYSDELEWLQVKYPIV